MKFSRLQVFEAPPSVDPESLRFASDVDWLRQQGVEVERHSLSFDPAAFAGQEAVREALRREGNDCLPLVLMGESIVSRGAYPSRRQLSEFVGIDEVATGAQPEDSAGASTHDPSSKATACGPGCDCGAVPSGRGRKAINTVVTVLALLAIVGALSYSRAGNARQTATTDMAAGDGSAFSVAQAAQDPAPGATAPSPEGMAPGKTADGAAAEPQPKGPNGTEGQPTTATGRIGEDLESLNDLNKVAQNQDTVFIFIPGAGSESVDDGTRAAVLAAQETLESKNTAVGLYTLPTRSSDYPAISGQVPGPAILVASKGRGMAPVSGDVTEAKLLQAFVASSRAGGCCPAGSGKSCPTG